MTVQSWGTGRVDYSQNVEQSVIPIIRSYQVNATAYKEFTLASGEESEETITLTFSEDAKNHFIGEAIITANANVLLSAEMWSRGNQINSTYGYQKIRIYFPQTLALSDLTIKIKNHSAISAKCTYLHNGVQGTEDIMTFDYGD